ncbi:terminase [Heyndrickxia shackletonii]|uniref:Terminase n=1 Tax=Heyndrickxia shackletonii TaxID=157838 RepID=A0A0Q3WWT0_9BACI|nr:terminase TerL endonuclease subunit [Heyndrickxia shackletonii]KQL54516.1 terminase [Heyndrickxia shackletonii]NEY99250.1 terminase [Heyndrickxia shackletonii]
MDSIQESKAYKYCQWCIKEDNHYVGKYVKKQAKAWIDIADGNNNEAYVDEEMFNKVCGILRLMVHPDLGCSVYEGMERYQWFFVTATLCTLSLEDKSFYYESSLLEISRKNFKTFISGVVFIIGMLLLPKFSRLFSVAPDYKLSSELKLAVKKIIKSSPLLEDRFKIKRDVVECKLTDIDYTPLAYSNDKLDGKLAAAYLIDEVGALNSSYPIEAMRSSQITLKDKLGILISTQYPSDHNALLEEIDYAKRVLDGLIENKRYFSLLYEPDENIRKEWETNDLVIFQSNPVAVDNDKVFKAIIDKRTMAILYESKRENYLCKHNNIMYKGLGADGYVSSDQIRACKADEEWDWYGKDVYVGADGAESFDNSSIAMLAYDEKTGIVHSKTWQFVQEDYIDEKSKREKFNYRKSIADKNTIICGESVLDYAQFEQFVVDLQEEYGVNIVGIGYDIRNLRNSAQKWERDYNLTTIEVKQHSSVLHPTIKWLKELILEQKFSYYNNLAYENHFTNCRCVDDTNLNKYINKKISVKTAGKVDMVFATINALFLLQQDVVFSNNDWTFQVI